MNHWQMIAVAYALTFAALALEIVLLFRRRRAALRHAQDRVEADEPQVGRGARAGAVS